MMIRTTPPANSESNVPLRINPGVDSPPAPGEAQPVEGYARINRDGGVEELFDGMGVRMLHQNALLIDYARSLLATSHHEIRFIWVGSNAKCLSVTVTVDPKNPGRQEATIALVEESPPFSLTLRELDVLTLIAVGLSNEEIGSRLSASPRTIAKHVENLLVKMDLPTRAAAAGIAVEHGILRLPAPGGVPLAPLAVGSVERALRDPRPSQPPMRSSSRLMRRPILIGAPRMRIGLASDDAKEMFNGASLAVSEINASGGVLGRSLELVTVDCDVNDAKSLTCAYHTFLGAEVDAIATGYSVAEAEMQDIVADYGCPYLHAATSARLVDRVRNEPTRYGNVFQVCPSDVEYGPALARFLFQLEESREWSPRNRRLLAFLPNLIERNSPTNCLEMDVGASELELMLSCRGWQVEVIGGISVSNIDWTRAMEAVHRYDPSVVFLAFPLPATISFQKAFLAAPTNSLIYAVYSPSVPAYRLSLGDAANGVLWSSTTGRYSDALGRGFVYRYRSRYGASPGHSHASIAYDRIRLLANAWARVGNSRAFARVAADLRTSIHRGINGSYFFGGGGQSSLAFEAHTRDPSISQAHLIFQIQGGRQAILSPSPYADAHFVLPPWFTKRN